MFFFGYVLQKTKDDAERVDVFAADKTSHLGDSPPRTRASALFRECTSGWLLCYCCQHPPQWLAHLPHNSAPTLISSDPSHTGEVTASMEGDNLKKFFC